MNVLVVQCGSMTFIAIIHIQDIFHKNYLHEVVRAEGFACQQKINKKKTLKKKLAFKKCDRKL